VSCEGLQRQRCSRSFVRELVPKGKSLASFGGRKIPFDTLWIDHRHGALPLPARPVPVRPARRVARHRVAATTCVVSGCPHAAAGYQIVRGWGKLCRAHVEIRWRYLSKGRQRFYLRRYTRRLRQATAEVRAARRVMTRARDGSDGR
jgi:hypothetical protein